MRVSNLSAVFYLNLLKRKSLVLGFSMTFLRSSVGCPRLVNIIKKYIKIVNANLVMLMSFVLFFVILNENDNRQTQS